MLIVSKSGHVGYKDLLCNILIKWPDWVTDMIKCRDAIASKNVNLFYVDNDNMLSIEPCPSKVKEVPLEADMSVH